MLTFLSPTVAKENVINCLKRATCLTKSWQAHISIPALCASILPLPREDPGEQLFCCRQRAVFLPWGAQGAEQSLLPTPSTQHYPKYRGWIAVGRTRFRPEIIYNDNNLLGFQGKPRNLRICKTFWGEILASLNTNGNSL